MAQDSDVPSSAAKGKGKAVEKPKDDKPTLNGKNEEEEKKDGRYFSTSSLPAVG